MQPLSDHDVRELAPAEALPIVVGAALEAELNDRRVAARLCAEVRAGLAAIDGAVRLEPVVLTDLWYLNDPALRVQPTISIGRPELNAVTAYLSARVPTAHVVEDAFRIQLDPELIDLHACVWGSDHGGTVDAVACFCERFLPAYLRGVELLG
jgi:hypothetical protein